MIYVFPFLVACSLLFFADLFNSELRPVEWPVQEARALLDSSSWIQESATSGPRIWHGKRELNYVEGTGRWPVKELCLLKDRNQGQERTRIKDKKGPDRDKTKKGTVLRSYI